MKKMITMIVVALLLGCNPNVTSTHYDTINKSKWNSTTIELKWVHKDLINDTCQRLGASDGPPAGGAFKACARSKPGNILICEIYISEPHSFNDISNLETLGHETWHCLGARHS